MTTIAYSLLREVFLSLNITGVLDCYQLLDAQGFKHTTRKIKWLQN